MNKQLLIVGIIVLLLAVGLSGCSESRDNRFVGTWKSPPLSWGNITITFFSNGTITRNNSFVLESGSWIIRDGKLVFLEIDLGGPYDYVFSNNDKTLTLTQLTQTGSSDVYVLTKQ